MCNNNRYYDLQDDDRTDEQLDQDQEIMDALEDSHCFVAKDENSKFCKICDKYVKDVTHKQAPALLQKQAI